MKKDRQKEAEELKKRKEEREEKKRERETEEREEERQEEGKRGREGEVKERERKEDTGQGKPKKGKQPIQAAMESLGSSSESECEVRSLLQRVRQLSARFQADSWTSSKSDSDSDILCGLCSAREPPNLNVVDVFWMDCGNSGYWFHTACAPGDNSRSRQYFCMNCV